MLRKRNIILNGSATENQVSQTRVTFLKLYSCGYDKLDYLAKIQAIKIQKLMTNTSKFRMLAAKLRVYPRLLNTFITRSGKYTGLVLTNCIQVALSYNN